MFMRRASKLRYRSFASPVEGFLLITARQHVADIKAVDSGWLDDDVEVSVCAVFWRVSPI